MADIQIKQDTELNQEALELAPPTSRAVAGQSLTNDPESPMPFEGQPEFTTINDALGSILSNLLEQEAIENVVNSLSKGVPVSEMAYMIVYEGFRLGKWNPDLMMLLAEPVMYILLYIAERAEIDDVVIYTGEQDEQFDDMDGQDQMRTMNSAKRHIGERSKLKKIEKNIPNIDNILPTEVVEKIEAKVGPSLLAEPEGEV